MVWSGRLARMDVGEEEGKGIGGEQDIVFFLACSRGVKDPPPPQKKGEKERGFQRDLPRYLIVLCKNAGDSLELPSSPVPLSKDATGEAKLEKIASIEKIRVVLASRSSVWKRKKPFFFAIVYVATLQHTLSRSQPKITYLHSINHQHLFLCVRLPFLLPIITSCV